MPLSSPMGVFLINVSTTPRSGRGRHWRENGLEQREELPADWPLLRAAVGTQSLAILGYWKCPHPRKSQACWCHWGPATDIITNQG